VCREAKDLRRSTHSTTVLHAAGWQRPVAARRVEDTANATKTRAALTRPVSGDVWCLGLELKAGGKAIGSSEQEHAVDALAMIGDEGRDSLR
jgi:hypothetical protein